MHEERTNNTDTHPKYDNFKMHQKIVSNLEKDDVVKLLVNDEVKFNSSTNSRGYRFIQTTTIISHIFTIK